MASEVEQGRPTAEIEVKQSRRSGGTVRLIICLFLLAMVCPAIVLAQCAFSPTEQQKVQLTLSEIQQVMQQARADGIEMPLDSFLVVDGQPSSAVELATRVKAILTSMPARDIYASNPLPGKLGVFWDFQISEPTLEFTGDTCHVNCTYLLVASGVRVGAGHIDFAKIGRSYHVTRLDGLVSFLNQELQALSASQRVRGTGK
jgi:hypothetical protein